MIMLIVYLIVIAGLAWVMRFVGQKATNNAPRFRDMSYGVAFGYVLAVALVLWLVWAYFQARSDDPLVANKFFFIEVAIEGFIIFAAAAWVFKKGGQYIGTEWSKKVFRSMPLTASFGILIIVAYVFVAIFAGQIAISAVVGVMLFFGFLVNFSQYAGDHAVTRRLTSFGLFISAIFYVMYLYGGLAPYGQDEIIQGAAANIVAGGDPAFGGNPDYPLGTDQIGRDIMSRLIYGAQNTVGIAFITTVLAFLLGGTMGFLAAVFGGWLDQLLSRMVDVLMAIPSLIFALLLMTIASVWASTLGIPLTIFMVLIIAVIDSTRVFRLARAVGQNIVVMDYIEAAKLRGEGMGYLVFKEILPNATAPLLAEFGLRFCFVFLTIASLSFLGVGIQPPLADWGTMVRDLAGFISYAQFAPQASVTPLLAAGAIALLTVAVNFVVDWMLHKSSGLKE